MVIADTGFWLALINPKDRFHAAALNSLQKLEEPLISTWPVLTETTYLLRTRIGSLALNYFMSEAIAGNFLLHPPQESDLPKLHELMLQYDSLPMDFADASLVLLAEILGHGRILSTDQRDFNAYRWKNTNPFENLLLNST